MLAACFTQLTPVHLLNHSNILQTGYTVTLTVIAIANWPHFYLLIQHLNLSIFPCLGFSFDVSWIRASW